LDIVLVEATVIDDIETSDKFDMLGKERCPSMVGE
jgi:hypothetical protein